MGLKHQEHGDISDENEKVTFSDSFLSGGSHSQSD